MPTTLRFQIPTEARRPSSRQLDAAPLPLLTRLRRRLDVRHLWCIDLDVSDLTLDDATLHADLVDLFERG